MNALRTAYALTLALLAMLACSCTTQPIITQVTPIAPVKVLPPKSTVPDLSFIAKKASEVGEKNTALRSEVALYKDANLGLTKSLRLMEDAGEATLEQLTSVRMKSESMQLRLQVVDALVATQREDIVQLGVEVHTRAKEASTLTQERDTLRGALVSANDDLVKLTAENNTVKGEGDRARLSAAALKEEVKIERKWKWKALKACVVLTLLLFGSWGIYFYARAHKPF